MSQLLDSSLDVASSKAPDVDKHKLQNRVIDFKKKLVRFLLHHLIARSFMCLLAPSQNNLRIYSFSNLFLLF